MWLLVVVTTAWGVLCSREPRSEGYELVGRMFTYDGFPPGLRRARESLLRTRVLQVLFLKRCFAGTKQPPGERERVFFVGTWFLCGLLGTWTWNAWVSHEPRHLRGILCPVETSHYHTPEARVLRLNLLNTSPRRRCFKRLEQLIRFEILLRRIGYSSSHRYAQIQLPHIRPMPLSPS